MNPCLDTNPRYGYSCTASSVNIIIMIFILQNRRGCPPPQQVWVFGMCDRSHTPALGVMRIVPNRSATTLLPIIQQHVRSGSTVHSDEWAAHNCVQRLPSVGRHRVVNHSLHFVDPANGVHTQHAESYWNRVKTKFKRMKGVHESMLPSYLDEFMWREHHGSTAFYHLLVHISNSFSFVFSTAFCKIHQLPKSSHPATATQ